MSWVLQHRAPTVAVFVLTLVATVWMFIIIPKGFIPDQDTDQMIVVTEAAQGTSYFKMVEHQKEVAELLRQDSNIESLVSNVGRDCFNHTRWSQFRPDGCPPQTPE